MSPTAELDSQLMLDVYDLEKLQKMAESKRTNKYQLSPEVWSTLPEHLMDTILLKAFNGAAVHFSRLSTFRCLGNRIWKELLLPCAHYIVYFQKGKLVAFNPRKDMWEYISLKFVERQLPGLVLSDLHLVATGGGLLHFSSKVEFENIVCNPLTKVCRKFTRSRPATGHHLQSANVIHQLQTRALGYTRWPAENQSDLETFGQGVVVFYSGIASGFTLMVERPETPQHDGHRMSVFECGRKVWTMEFDVGVRDSFYCCIDRAVVECFGTLLTLGFIRSIHAPCGFLRLVYDLNRKACAWYQDFAGRPLSISGSLGYKRLVVNMGNKLEFFELHLRPAGHSLLPSSTNLSRFLVERRPDTLPIRDINASEDVNQVVTKMVTYKTVYAEQEGVAYAVGLAQWNRSSRTFTVTSVRMHNRVDNSEFVSERKADWGFTNGRCSCATCFHVFKPTEAPV